MHLQPELCGWIGTPQGGVALNFGSVIANLGVQLDHFPGESQDKALEALLDELHTLLATRRVEFALLAPLSGMVADLSDEHVTLAPHTILRRLTDSEIEELSSNDALSSSLIPRYGGLLAALESHFTSPLFLGAHPADAIVSDDEFDASLAAIDTAHCVLHSFKEGAARILFQAVRPLVRSLPGLGGSYLIPPSPQTPTAYMLAATELADLQCFAQAFGDTRLPEQRFAAGRLRDSELRTSPRDAVVDAFVGIEALLNPFSDGELSYRMAMNYASLGAPEVRHARYRKFRDLYKVRNRVVHGGVDQEQFKVEGNALSITGVSQMAKALLRELVKQFAEFPALRALPALDAEFWEDQCFEAHRGSQ
jgi:hypothetical protein